MTVKKYILTSQSFDGQVIFGYSYDKLYFYSNESEMNDKQVDWLLNNLPRTIKALEAVKPLIKGKIEEMPIDLSFDTFWEAYGKKVNRKRCVPLWNKLSEANKFLCVMSVKSYDGYLKRSNGRAKLDPENYLKKEAYNNNWNQL